MPAASRKGKGTHSGLRLAVVDPDAAVTAPGGASFGKVEDAGRGASEVSRNADISGKVFAERLGDCSRSPSASQDLVADARGYSGKYASEAGFRRCASRVGVPNTRASWFVRDVPEFLASPTWLLFETFRSMRIWGSRRVQSYRFAESPPWPEPLRGSLYNEGFAC